MQKNNIKVQSFHNDPAKIQTIGDKELAISGQVVPSMEKRILQAQDFNFGVGASTPKNIESLGESMILGERCYTRSTDEGSSEYLNIISGKEFRSAATMFVPKSYKANGSLRSLNTLHLSTFYANVMEEINYPLIAMAGIGKFKTIYVNTLHRAPIQGVSMRKNKKHYFPYETKVLKNVYGVLVSFLYKKGTSLDFDARFKNLLIEHQESSELHRIHDVSLEERSLYNKSRFMVLSNPVSSYESVTPQDVSSLWIVYLKESVLTEYSGEFFLIDDVINTL